MGSPQLTSQEKLCRFEEQISPHLKSAYNLAKWITRRHEDAEDVVQEAFLRAFLPFEGLRGGGPKPGLLTIVRNPFITWLRRNRNAKGTVAFDETIESPSEPSPGPEEML